MSQEETLLVIGAGTLGGRVGVAWRASHPGAEVIAESGKSCAMRKIGLQDEFSIVGYPDDLLHVYKMDADGILEAGAASVTLGGDHYISFPILKAYAEKFGREPGIFVTPPAAGASVPAL